MAQGRAMQVGPVSQCPSLKAVDLSDSEVEPSRSDVVCLTGV